MYRVACAAEACLAAVLCGQNDMPAAQAHLDRGVDLARNGTTERARLSLYMSEARMRFAHGDATAALQMLAQSEQFM